MVYVYETMCKKEIERMRIRLQRKTILCPLHDVFLVFGTTDAVKEPLSDGRINETPLGKY